MRWPKIVRTGQLGTNSCVHEYIWCQLVPSGYVRNRHALPTSVLIIAVHDYLEAKSDLTGVAHVHGYT